VATPGADSYGSASGEGVREYAGQYFAVPLRLSLFALWEVAVAGDFGILWGHIGISIEHLLSLVKVYSRLLTDLSL
jgi:hypothetical protein